MIFFISLFAVRLPSSVLLFKYEYNKYIRIYTSADAEVTTIAQHQKNWHSPVHDHTRGMTISPAARSSHLQRHQLLQALESLHSALSRLIGEGHIVDVPFLGTFRLTVCARIADRYSDAGGAALKRVNVAYRPARLMLPENITSSATHII